MLETQPTLIAGTSNRRPIGALLAVLRCHIAAIPGRLRCSPAIFTGPAVQTIAPVGQNSAVQTASQVDRYRDWTTPPLLLAPDPAPPVASPALRYSLLDGQSSSTLPRAAPPPRRPSLPLLTVGFQSYLKEYLCVLITGRKSLRDVASLQEDSTEWPK